MYECNICDYKTEYSSNFSIHKKTMKHINNLKNKSIQCNENINKKYINVNSKPIVDISLPIEVKKLVCKKCNFTTFHKSSLSRHNKSCNIKKENDNIEKFEFEKKILEKEFEIKYKVLEKEKEIEKRLK